MTFKDLIKAHVTNGVQSFKRLSDGEKTEIAIAYFAPDHARSDVSEILRSDPDVDEMFARAKDGSLAELGALFVRAMHAGVQYAVDMALEEERRRREEERQCAEEDRRGYLMERSA